MISAAPRYEPYVRFSLARLRGSQVDESAIDSDTRCKLRPAVSVDAKHATTSTSGLTCEVEAVPSFATKRKHYDFVVE